MCLSPEWEQLWCYLSSYNGPIVRSIAPRAAGGSEAWQDESGMGLRCGASPPLNRLLCLQTYPGIFFDHMVGMDGGVKAA